MGFEHRKHTGCAAREQEAASKAPGLSHLRQLVDVRNTSQGLHLEPGKKIPDSVGDEVSEWSRLEVISMNVVLPVTG